MLLASKGSRRYRPRIDRYTRTTVKMQRVPPSKGLVAGRLPVVLVAQDERDAVSAALLHSDRSLHVVPRQVSIPFAEDGQSLSDTPVRPGSIRYSQHAADSGERTEWQLPARVGIA